MKPPTVPVTPALAAAIVERIAGELPPSWLVMPIGGTAMAKLAPAPGSVTKDVDLVVVAMQGADLAIPAIAVLVEAARPILSQIEVRKDQTSISGTLETTEGAVKVEFIRGRRSAAGGYFVTRKALVAIAKSALRTGSVLQITEEALAFMKAWAAVDQEKLIANGKDSHGFHAARAKGFRRDTRMLRDRLAEIPRQPVGSRLNAFLSQVGPGRRDAIEEILRTNGWAAALTSSERTA